MSEKIIIDLLIELVSDIVNKNFKKIEEESRNGCISISDLEKTLLNYGGVLTQPPQSDFVNVNIIQTIEPSEHFIEYELWFDNEKSDLTISCDVTIKGENGKIVMQDLRVL